MPRFRTLLPLRPGHNRRVEHFNQVLLLQALNLAQGVLGAIRFSELEDGYSCHNAYSFCSFEVGSPTAGRLPERQLTAGRLRNGISCDSTKRAQLDETPMAGFPARRPGAAVHSWNTRNVPRRFALLAGFVMVGTWAKASTKCGFATKQAARQPLKRARARPISE